MPAVGDFKVIKISEVYLMRWWCGQRWHYEVRDEQSDTWEGMKSPLSKWLLRLFDSDKLEVLRNE